MGCSSGHRVRRSGLQVAKSTGRTRRGGARRLAVEFNLHGRDLVSVASEARAEVQRLVALPPSDRVMWGGELENYLHSRARLLVVVPTTFGRIVLLAWLAFRSVRLATLVLVGVPFAMVRRGCSPGIPFSISTAVGFIAVPGVAVLNVGVLVSAARGREASGIAPAEAIRRAAERRLRPVVISALVAALGPCRPLPGLAGHRVRGLAAAVRVRVAPPATRPAPEPCPRAQRLLPHLAPGLQPPSCATSTPVRWPASHRS